MMTFTCCSPLLFIIWSEVHAYTNKPIRWLSPSPIVNLAVRLCSQLSNTIYEYICYALGDLQYS
jgi:hypothetical protein